MPERHQGTRTTRNLIERKRRRDPQPPQYFARLVGAGGRGGDNLRRAGTGAEGCAGQHRPRRHRGSIGPQAQYPCHLGRRCRRREHQRLLERPDGLRDAEHRPHRPRGHQVPALLRRAVLHRRPRGVPDRAARHPHRPDQGRLSRRADGHEPAGSLDRRPAQEPRLRHGAVRQEPRRRPQRVAADRERLRRVLRQPLSSQRRGRAGTAGLSEGPGLPRQVRPARRAQMQGDRPRRSHGRSALRQDRQADHRGHRRADQEAHGDDRRRDLGRGHRLHEAAAGRRQAVLLLVQCDAHAPANACPRRASRPLHPRRQRIHRRHARARRHRRHACSRRWTTWASPTTPSSSTPATTGPT